MSPFFLRQYVKGHANDVFEAYPHLLTEMALRLPYQVQKHLDTTPPTPATFEQVCCCSFSDYYMTQFTLINYQFALILCYSFYRLGSIIYANI